ncbi:MAG: hypothetical protein JSV13_03870 [Nitrospiraceae bacterium]|jgi:hypothetical protein|nr:MAG: hypothetical protein JSV13_03870 [Nitrospiraceae bacterium]
MMSRFTFFMAAILAGIVLVTAPVYGAQDIVATKAAKAPTLDGSGDDAVWAKAQTYTIHDERMKADITLKALYANNMVFFLVQYPDRTEDRLHKPWVWNKELEIYKPGNQREDTFIFKWNMEKHEVDLSNFADNNYVADVWYWKAHRTNPAGYSDDKSQVFSSESGKKATEIISRTGKKRYLMRLGDAGTSAQKKQVLTDYAGDVQPQYVSRQPSGSRADVKAKGVWKNGQWTIEYERKLVTGNADDVQFSNLKKKYLFGVSIKSLYGEEFDNSVPNFYGQGRISEKLYLVFK